MTDRQKKGLIFNTETGISEDGTMHDGVYRQWINQPKKEQKMTREEALVTIARYNDWDYRETTVEGANGIQVRVNHYKRDLERAFEVLQEPPTLCDFLVWEEGQEYEWRGDIFRIQSDILQVYDKEDESWYDSVDELNDYLRLRQAKKVEKPKLKSYLAKDTYSLECLMKELKEQGYQKVLNKKSNNDDSWYVIASKDKDSKLVKFDDIEKYFTSHEIIEYHKVEPKLKAWYVKDEYSFNCLMKELAKPYMFVHSVENYIYEKDRDGRKYYQWTDDFEEIKDTHEVIDYHKEEPKYYAKIKGWELTYDDEVYFVVDCSGGGKEMFIGKKDCKRYSDDFHNEYTKTQWTELGIDEDNAEFERVDDCKSCVREVE